MRDDFTLDPGIAHLNHGSFGAVPRVVQEEQQRVRRRAEANPMRFHRHELPELVARARAVAGDLLGVAGTELALVRNVTEATTVVMSTLRRTGRLRPGSVLVVNDHGYGAVRLCLEQWARRYDAGLETVHLPPSCEPGAVVAAHRAVLERLAEQGRRPALLVLDAVTSPTGAVLPAAELTVLTRQHGAVSFVDAAHAPGHLPDSPAATGADFWAGAFHKWAYAPRGTSALWVGPAMRDRVEPVTTSWNRDEPFPLSFDWRGTDDYSGWLSLAAAARFWRDLGGFAAVEARRRLLERMAARVYSRLPGATEAGTPAGPGTPAAPAPCLRLLPLPAGVAVTADEADRLYDRLSARGVEVQVVAFAGRGYLRLSAAPYNTEEDYDRLAAALCAELG